MRGSFQIAKIFGIPVQLHWSFGLVFVWVLYLGFREDWGWDSIAWSLMFVLALFVCVVMHEFGHALTARRFGVSTRDIILSPIGGVARLDRLPEKPMQEFYVAIAGPLVNVGIMAALSPYLLLMTADQRLQLMSILNKSNNVFIRDLTPLDFFFFGLIVLNGTLAAFNLIPAFPMDGGRVLRALLSLRLGRMRATRIAAYIGQAMALGLLIYGILQFSPITAFIGLFVFFTAANEFRMVRIDNVLEQFTVADIVRPNFTRLYHHDSMELVAELVTHGWEKQFIVFDEWQTPVGRLSEESIMRAVRQKAFDLPVAHFMENSQQPLLLQDSLKTAFGFIQQHQVSIFPVYDHAGRLAGVLDAARLYDFMQMQQKLQR